MDVVNLIQGDCRKVLALLDDNSVDAIVTDPPYELGFMGKAWDASGIANSVKLWREALRVLKPGGHLLAFSGSRTYHRMTCAIEDAGFEIRDQIMWVYGSGFPKSLDVSKAIDKAAGAEREVVGVSQWAHVRGGNRSSEYGFNAGDAAVITAPATDAARQWQGWGTALKPAHEPICVARKPLIGTVAQNVLAHGTGALNIDGCRVGSEIVSTHSRGANGAFPKRPGETSAEESGRKKDQREGLDHSERAGRWPANLIHDGSDEVVALFPAEAGQVAALKIRNSDKSRNTFGEFAGTSDANFAPHDARGSAARFFYCAKASKRDRDEDNTHPTVKPTALMRYLVRLVTPPGGVVLDPFLGSGSTGKACMFEGFRFIGIELSPEYLEIARARIDYYNLA